MGGIQNMSLLQVIEDAFVKASESAHLVSKIIETDSPDNYSGDTNPSMGVLRLFDWNMSSKGQQVASNDYAAKSVQTHSMILRKILAWEEKLYDEVKDFEEMQLLYKKKMASLNKVKERGGRGEVLA